MTKIQKAPKDNPKFKTIDMFCGPVTVEVLREYLMDVEDTFTVHILPMGEDGGVYPLTSMVHVPYLKKVFLSNETTPYDSARVEQLIDEGETTP